MKQIFGNTQNILVYSMIVNIHVMYFYKARNGKLLSKPRTLDHFQSIFSAVFISTCWLRFSGSECTVI